MTRIRRLVVFVGALALVGTLLTATPALAAVAFCPGQSAANSALGEIRASLQPVVLVHGWIGGASSMTKAADGLGRILNPSEDRRSVTFLYFDYRAANFRWAAQPEVAACLAEYLRQVSDAHRKVGGNGKVLVVAHSMGGLATVFATDATIVKQPAGGILGGLVTLDSPFLGSPFGNQAVARGVELVLGSRPQPLIPKSGTDASICLALHGRKTKLPERCANFPYLPVSVPLTQIAGDAVISRSLFGIHLYDIDVASDGIVGADSSQGYLESGLPDITGQSQVRAPRGSKVALRLERCTIGLDQVWQVAVAQGLAESGVRAAFANFLGSFQSNPIKTLFGTLSDGAAMDDILAERQGKELLRLLAAVTFGAGCSHIGITSYGPAIDETAAALRGYIAALPKPAPVCPNAQEAKRIVVAEAGASGPSKVSYVECEGDWAATVLTPDPPDPVSPESLYFALRRTNGQWQVVDYGPDFWLFDDKPLCHEAPPKIRARLCL